jgi:AraC family transcriptional activator of pobA
MSNLPVYGITDFLSEKKETLFYANDLKAHLQSHQFVNSPHRHNTYITILFTKGTGAHQIDFSSYKVIPGSVFLLSPGQAHSWSLSEDANGFVFFHTGDFYNSIYVNRKVEDFPFFYLSSNYPVVYCHSKNINKIEELFKEILNEFKTGLIHRERKLGSLVDLVYVELTRIYYNKGDNQEKKNSNYTKVKNLLKLIDENFKRKKSAAEYADLMNMTSRHLSRICQEVLNKSTSDLIYERIILEAKRLLTHTDTSVSRVAEQLGFDDYSYFVRFFKTREGKTPKEFQNSMFR